MSFSKAISLAVLAGAVATLVGCAQRAPIPVAENFEYTSQPKVRSAGHWDLVSRDVVNQTLSTLDKAGVAPNTPPCMFPCPPMPRSLKPPFASS